MTTTIDTNKTLNTTVHTAVGGETIIVVEGVMALTDANAPTFALNVIGNTLSVLGTVHNTQTNAVTSSGRSHSIYVGLGGRITGVGFAVSLDSSTSSVWNDGEIHGVSSTGNLNTIFNTGTISGAIGVNVTGSGASTVKNHGLITGTGGVAISFAGGSDYLDSRDGQVIGVVNGGAGNDTLLLGEGDDTLDGGAGADSLNGGAGFDFVSYASATAGVVASLANRLINFGDARGDRYGSIEGLIESAGADRLQGDTGDNILDGGDGADTLIGGAGDDIYYVNQSRDMVIELAGGGQDTIYTTASYTLQDLPQVENLSAFNALLATIVTLTGNNLANILTGHAGSDTLYGDGGNDTIIGGGGSDIVYGGAGNDTMIGGDGNDQYVVDQRGDVVEEAATPGSGIDTIHTALNYTLGANIERLVLYFGAPLKGTGNALANAIIGNNGANVLNGLGGNDTLDGGLGNDGLNGGDGNDSLDGNLGNDKLNGGAGNDSLYGGLGNDVLSGGLGDDKFMFKTTLGKSNVDKITDFTSSSTEHDVFQLDKDVFTAILPLGTLADAAFQTDTKARQPDDRIIYDQATGSLYYDKDGDGPVAQTKFAVLINHPVLTAAVFSVLDI